MKFINHIYSVCGSGNGGGGNTKKKQVRSFKKAVHHG